MHFPNQSRVVLPALHTSVDKQLTEPQSLPVSFLLFPSTLSGRIGVGVIFGLCNRRLHEQDSSLIGLFFFILLRRLQFRRLLEQGNRDLTTATGNRCSKCSPDCSDSCKLHPVQQGEVSSTEPPLPEPSVNGHSPEKSAYFEAVQYYISNIGWALLEINSDGVIECATENVRDVLHYSRNELHGQSIYSYLHTGDHSKLSPILNKNSFELNWDQDEVGFPDYG